MTTYRVEIDKRAHKDLAALDKPVRLRVMDAINALADNPRPPGIKAMKGATDLYRLRVGDYRVIYTVQDQRLVVLVLEMGHRREVYR